MRILIIEDDQIIGDGLSTALKIESYATDWVRNKEDASSALSSHVYDMILLDIGLPDGSGLDLLNDIRQKKNYVPIIVLTAYDKTEYKVKGLDIGADDYLTKPFKLAELKARIRALNRRRKGNVIPLLKIGTIELNPASKKVTKSGKSVTMRSKEFAILKILMERSQDVVSKRTIEDNLYGWGMEIESNTVEVYVSKLRKKLGKKAIETIKNEGYRFATIE